MALQSSNLVMSAIGIQNFVQPNPNALPLTNGIHLRWQFSMERGFPWYGYYLFRRNHIPHANTGDIRILTSGWLGINGVQQPYGNVNPMTHTDNTLPTSMGTWISDAPIVLTDDFAPMGAGGLVEIDLENRLFTRFVFPLIPSRRVALDLGFKAPGATVDVKFMFNNQVVYQVTLDDSSDNTFFPFAGYEYMDDAINSIEFSGANVVVRNLSLTPVATLADHQGWHLLPNFGAPHPLPSNAAAYPCPTKPGSFALASTMAEGRIHYGNAADRISDSFQDIHEQLDLLLQGGEAGPSMYEVSGEHFEESEGSSPGEKALRMSNQRPLELLALGGIEPSIAQLLGIYHVDQGAIAGTNYDYFLIADHDGSFGNLIQAHTVGNNLNETTLMAVAFDPAMAAMWDSLDGWLCYNRSLNFSPALPAPTGLTAYALPGVTVRDEATGLIANPDQVNSAGFTWELGLGENGALLPYRPVTYQVWREAHGANEPVAAGAPAAFTPTTTHPFLVAKDKSPADELAFEPPVQTTSSQFPPFRLLAYDNYRADGWYSYRLSGMDLFGRHSPFSDPATWRQWANHPEPLPHYYLPFGGDTQIHAFAVHLLDETPPPPPTGVEASALDPLDDYLVRDTPYNNWRDMLDQQAWYQALSSSEQDDLCGLRVRWKWTNWQMRQAPDTAGFRIHYSGGSFIKHQGRVSNIVKAGANLILSVELVGSFSANEFQGDLIQIGPHSYPILQNSNGFPIEISVRDTGQTIQQWDRFTIRTDHSKANEWAHHLLEVDYADHNSETVRVATDPIGNSLEGSPTLGDGVTIFGNIVDIPNNFDLSTVQKGFHHILLFLPNGGDAEIHLIEDVDIPGRRVFTTANIGLNALEASWRLGLLVRQYEVFLPNASGTMQSGVPELVPSLENPTVFGNVGVSAIDGNDHESRVGAPAKVYRVLRQPPPPPIPPLPDSDSVYASPADYNGDSFYTYRWTPSAHLRTHIYRALDESVFLEDYAIRPKAPADSDFIISDLDLSIFPDPIMEPLWSAQKRTEVAAELNALNAATRSAADAKAAMPAYRSLTNDALRVLGGLSHVTEAFSQVTLKALNPDHSANNNRRGPDNPDNYPVDPSLRAYIDTLPGKARSRYFYRAAYIDGAENVSSMSLSSVPVYLPDVVAPKAPKISKAVGGDREIRLEWAGSQEKNLTRIRMYRTAEKDNARDIRLMGEPVADMPGETLRMAGGILPVGAATDIASIERAYHAGELGNNDDPYLGESATHFPAYMVNLQNGELSIPGVPDETPMVLVYRDSNGILQRTPCMNRPRVWTDSSTEPGVKYYYRPTYVKQTEINGQTVEVNSESGNAVVAKPFTSQPPATPSISNMEWVLLDPGTNAVEAWPVSGVLPPDRVPAVRLQVNSSESKPKFYLNRKTRKESLWRSVTVPLRNTAPGAYELLDPDPDPLNYQSYRVKVVAASGMASQGYKPQEIAPPTLA